MIDRKKTIIAYLMLIFIFIFLSLPQILYRFRNPEMTDTQRFLNFFEAYKEFYGGFLK